MTLEPNNTMVDRPGEGEMIFWIIFHVTIALLSLTGDSIILIGTIRYRAIKLHRVIVVIIQHLAVGDLLLTVFKVVPTIVSLVAEEWVMGTFLCHMNLYVVIVCIPAAAILTSLLSTCKLLIVQYPLRTETWTRKRAHFICGLSWLLCTVRPRMWENVFFINTESYSLDYILYLCQGDLTDIPGWFIWCQEIFIYLAFLAVFVILITTSVLLLYKARKAAVRIRESVRWQGTFTVMLTTGVFMVSYLPDSIVPLIDSHVTVTSSIRRSGTFSVTINIAANVFVYSLTVRSFREFLFSRIRLLARKLGFISPATPRALRQMRTIPGDP